MIGGEHHMTVRSRSGIGRRAFLSSTITCASAAAILGPSPLLAQDGERQITITRLNWAGLKIEFGNVAAYIDTIRPDGDPAAINIPTNMRSKYALVTHAHGDHFDGLFLSEILGERGVIFLQRDSTISQTMLREDRVNLWQPFFLPRSGADMVGFAVPAEDGFGDNQVSWVIECNGKRIIHCGDTMWHGRFYDIGAAYGPFDIAFLPINGAQQEYGRFRSLGQAGSMAPEQAVAAARALNANMVVPIHHGQPDPPSYTEEADALARFLSEARSHGIATRIMEPGQSLLL